MSNFQNSTGWFCNGDGFICYCLSRDKPATLSDVTLVPHGVPNYQQLDCLVKSLFRLTSGETRKVGITGLLWGESIGDVRRAMSCQDVIVYINAVHFAEKLSALYYRHSGLNLWLRRLWPIYWIPHEIAFVFIWTFTWFFCLFFFFSWDTANFKSIQVWNKANLRDLIAATGLVSNLAQIWSQSSIFQPVWPWNIMNGLGNH